MTDAVQTAANDAREASKSRVTTQETILAKLAPQKAASEPDPEKDGEHDKEGKSGKKSAQERIRELADKRREAEAKAEEAERRVQELEARLAAQSANAKPLEAGDRPLRSQFATQEEYEDAVGEWKAKQILAKREAEHQQARIEAEQAEIARQWEKRQQVAMKEIADYADVVGASELQVPDVAFQAMLEHDMGPKIGYYLALHPEEAKRLSGMRAIQVVNRINAIGRDLADIEKDDSEPEAEKEKPKVQKSKAPPPIEPVKSVPSATGSSSNSYEEYKRRRQAESRK